MMFEVLGPDGERLDSAQLERTFRANSEGTHNFAINHSGHYVMRLSIRGTEGTKYTVALGGSALDSSGGRVTREPAILAREQAK